jgi:phage/plasmid-like protein (TIGR03299 family)
MSHELEMIDGDASFAFNSNRGLPWHRLGVAMDGDQDAATMLRAANADYEVILTPQTTPHPITGEPVYVEDNFVTGRFSPHTGEYETWAPVKGRYAVVQNEEVLSKALAVVGSSMGDTVIDTLGVLNDGKRFFATISMEDLVIDPLGVNDVIKRNLVVESSHDGTTPVRYINTDVRAVCANTVRFARMSAQSMFTARHTTNVANKLAEAGLVLGISNEWSTAFRNEAEQLLAATVSDFDVSRVLNDIWPEKKADTDRKARTRDENIVSVRSRLGSNKNAAAYGMNAWSLLQAVTEHFDHGRGVDAEKAAEDSMTLGSVSTKGKLTAHESIRDRVLALA